MSLRFYLTRLFAPASPDECIARLQTGQRLFGVQISEVTDNGGPSMPASVLLHVRRWWSLSYQSDNLVKLQPAGDGTSVEVTSALRLGLAVVLLVWLIIWLLAALFVSQSGARVFFVIAALLPVISILITAPLQARYALNYVKRELDATVMK